MKFIGSVLLGLVVMVVTGSQVLGFAVAMFAYFAIGSLDIGWLRK